MNILFFEALYIYKFNLCVNIKNNISKKEASATREQIKKIRKI